MGVAFVSTDFYFAFLCLKHEQAHMCLLCVLMDFVSVGFHRAVRGVVVHGDASGSEGHHKSRGPVFGACVWPLCRAHRVHPARHGRLVGVPPCSPPPLVSLSSYD